MLQLEAAASAQPCKSQYSSSRTAPETWRCWSTWTNAGTQQNCSHLLLNHPSPSSSRCIINLSVQKKTHMSKLMIKCQSSSAKVSSWEHLQIYQKYSLGKLQLNLFLSIWSFTYNQNNYKILFWRSGILNGENYAICESQISFFVLQVIPKVSLVQRELKHPEEIQLSSSQAIRTGKSYMADLWKKSTKWCAEPWKCIHTPRTC